MEDRMAGIHNITQHIMMKGDERALKRARCTSKLGKDGNGRWRSGLGPRKRTDGMEGLENDVSVAVPRIR